MKPRRTEQSAGHERVISSMTDQLSWTDMTYKALCCDVNASRNSYLKYIYLTYRWQLELVTADLCAYMCNVRVHGI